MVAKMQKLSKKAFKCNCDTIFNISQLGDNQRFAKKLQKGAKKSLKKMSVVLKKIIPLQRFNKQMIVLQILKSKEMKKIAFMFVAAALFAACGEKKAPAQEEVVAEVAEVAEAVATAEDSAAVAELVASIEDEAVKDSTFKALLDSVVAAKGAVEEVVETVEEAAE